MTVFHYPKIKHQRTLNPRVFKNYPTYKKYLQAEFIRVCVYCRQPDSSAPNLNFSVDHYKPKDQFRELICAYDNLYYCCGNCNSRKNNYWPREHSTDPYVLNPCDYEMAAHLRFSSETGEMVPSTVDGQHTIDLLQLNAPALVQFRLSTLRIINRLEKDVSDDLNALKPWTVALKAGKISEAEYSSAVNEVEQRIGLTKLDIARFVGTLPLKPLSVRRVAALVQ